jgi:hypothetical protein
MLLTTKGLKNKGLIKISLLKLYIVEFLYRLFALQRFRLIITFIKT